MILFSKPGSNCLGVEMEVNFFVLLVKRVHCEKKPVDKKGVVEKNNFGKHMNEMSIKVQ